MFRTPFCSARVTVLQPQLLNFDVASYENRSRIISCEETKQKSVCVCLFMSKLTGVWSISIWSQLSFYKIGFNTFNITTMRYGAENWLHACVLKSSSRITQHICWHFHSHNFINYGIYINIYLIHLVLHLFKRTLGYTAWFPTFPGHKQIIILIYDASTWTNTTTEFHPVCSLRTKIATWVFPSYSPSQPVSLHSSLPALGNGAAWCE